MTNLLTIIVFLLFYELIYCKMKQTSLKWNSH
jgi:hypothetical protein